MAQDQVVQGERRIVVGVDGSAPSRAALAWAVRQAAVTGAAVEAVIAWGHPTSNGVFIAADAGQDKIATQILAKTIASVGAPDQVRSRVMRGYPARVLIDASADAELLVVGGCWHAAEFLGAPLGAVSQRCVHHAHCPVVVIRGNGLAPRRRA